MKGVEIHPCGAIWHHSRCKTAPLGCSVICSKILLYQCLDPTRYKGNVLGDGVGIIITQIYNLHGWYFLPP